MQCAAGEIRGKEPGDAGLALKAENLTNSCAALGFGYFSQELWEHPEFCVNGQM